MPIINKDYDLMKIAGFVGKSRLDFEGSDRPAVQMNGRNLFIGSVSYDFDLGEIVYSVVDASGFELSSEFSARRITELRPDVLAQVRECSQMYAGFRRSRAENISDIESQLRHMNRKGLKPQKHSLGRSS